MLTTLPDTTSVARRKRRIKIRRGKSAVRKEGQSGGDPATPGRRQGVRPTPSRAPSAAPATQNRAGRAAATSRGHCRPLRSNVLRRRSWIALVRYMSIPTVKVSHLQLAPRGLLARGWQQQPLRPILTLLAMVMTTAPVWSHLKSQLLSSPNCWPRRPQAPNHQLTIKQSHHLWPADPHPCHRSVNHEEKTSTATELGTTSSRSCVVAI